MKRTVLGVGLVVAAAFSCGGCGAPDGEPVVIDPTVVYLTPAVLTCAGFLLTGEKNWVASVLFFLAQCPLLAARGGGKAAP